jgi:F-type H+-transporting ATPase subunit delta
MHKANICVRYAKALYGHASERKHESVVYASANLMMKNFGLFPSLKEVLANPSVPGEKKRELLITAAGGDIPVELSGFIDLLIKNNRENEIIRIFRCYADLYRRRKNITACRLTTATLTDKQTEDRIISMVKAKTGGEVEMEKSVDPSIMGGFLFEMNYNLLDASVAGQLKQMRKKLSESL